VIPRHGAFHFPEAGESPARICVFGAQVDTLRALFRSSSVNAAGQKGALIEQHDNRTGLIEIKQR